LKGQPLKLSKNARLLQVCVSTYKIQNLKKKQQAQRH